MKITFPGGKRVDAAYGGFVIATDQPKQRGGEGSAPAPFDLFVGSLGTCAGIYVLEFLESRKLPTQGVALEVRTVKDRERKMLSDVEIRVSLPDGFPERYRNAIVKSVELCSVKKHLFDPPRMRTVVAVGDRVVAEATTSPAAAVPGGDRSRPAGSVGHTG